jgi:Uncharacterized protein conserved in bacteria
MNETINRFLAQQTCATICCSDDQGDPYCFSCYYVFNPEKKLLYFKSSDGAHHTTLLVKNPRVAGTVLPDRLTKLVTRGVQLQGEILEQEDPLVKDAFSIYHKNLPLALAMKGQVFVVRLDKIKMTDSKLGFGKKLAWDRAPIGEVV